MSQTIDGPIKLQFVSIPTCEHSLRGLCQECYAAAIREAELRTWEEAAKLLNDTAMREAMTKDAADWLQHMACQEFNQRIEQVRKGAL